MKDTVQICATIKVDVRDKVQLLAQSKKWTFSQYIANLLEEHSKRVNAKK